MKKIYALLFLLGTFFSEAQTPMFWNYNNAGANNSFPFNSFTSRKVQWRILPNSLGAVTSGNMITAVYFRINNTGSMTYPILNIGLKQGPSQLAGGGLFDTGFTTVYAGTNVTAGGTAGNWMMFTLQTPFLYDPNLPLLLDVEHNATSGGPGIWVDQTSPAGPGFGRQYGPYGSANYTGGDASVVHFGIDVIPATPCTAAPPSNSIIPSSFTTCPGLTNPSMSVAASYSLGGLTYQWHSSTVSPVGPYAPIPNYTLATTPPSTLGVTTWFQLVATCTNISTNNSTTVSPSHFIVGGPTSSVVPYYESFEGIQMNNRLPNCSWLASSLGNMNQTSMTSGSGNRQPRTGQKFASFSNSPSGTSYYYTNPIQMNSKVTYSAALYFATEYFGYNNWSNLSIHVSTSQTPNNLVQIASISPAISGPYKLLDGTFTVPSAGPYYIVIKATSTSGNATYLTWDDLSVTIPCTPESGNTPTLSMSATINTVCAGVPVTLNASGADAYLWFDGTTQSSTSLTAMTTTILSVTGTSTLTNCSMVSSDLVVVNPTPNVVGVANKYEVCPGAPVYLSAFGADSHAWQGQGPGNVVTVNPMATTAYTVQGTSLMGCTKDAVVTVSVMEQPTVTGSSQSAKGESCIGDMVTLNGGGAATYTWLSSTDPTLLQGDIVNVILYQSTTFTVIGQAANTCTNQFTVNQNVNACVGLETAQAGSELVKMFPNPTNGMLHLELGSNGAKTIEITDISGRVVLHQQTSGTVIKLDISSLAAGVYNATVKTKDYNYSSKLIKN